jgi:hypothetical protein
MIRKVAIRIFVLLLIITVLNIIYSATLYKRDLAEKYPESLDIRAKQPETDVFYFGESSNITYKESDSVKNSISEITNWFLPDLRIRNINKYATHGGIYKHWLKEIDLKNNKPKAIIVTLNLRSFDAAWIHSKLETALQEAIVLKRSSPPIINRFLLSLQAFDNKTEKERELDMLHDWKTVELKFPFQFKYKTVSEWDGAMANGTYLRPDGSWDMEKIALACHYIKSYAFNINDKNPRVKDFDEVAAWCDKNGIRLYLNLMAENIQYADSLVGKELVFLMRQNRDFLVKRYSTNNCKVVDNLEIVPGIEFIDQNWTTEHYDYRGRMTVAKNLAKSLKEQFNSQYKEVY